ncbi:MAG: hypothetical protein CSA95_04070 [Bacteroidetes bacterium]|nr:MAG: hypothetical protein CSA95_04070 [Bacteroidota bacterium]
MENMEEIYVEALKVSNKISERAIREAIKDLGLFAGAKVLDVPCGIGNHISWMLDENDKISITGIDIGKKQLAYAKNLLAEKHPDANYKFQENDINKLELEDNYFDFIWCCDGLWPGPPEMGCLAEEPYDILKDFIRIAKPGAKIVVVFWSSQKILSGYPYLESALNNTRTANRPFREKGNPDLHILRTPAWFKKVGLDKITVKSYAADIYNVNPDMFSVMPLLFKMFWSQAKSEVSEEIWQQYTDIINPKSENYLLKDDCYTGLMTYTTYIATVEK